LNKADSHSASLSSLISSLKDNRPIILRMTVREVISRYRGSVLGIAWSFFNPLLLLLVYTFVFTVVFQARWGTTDNAIDDKAGFSIMIFSGMIVHGLFAECFNRAPTLITSNSNYVKKVVFPLEILPWIVMGSAVFHAIVSVFVLLVAQLILAGSIPWTAILLPVILLPLSLLTMGISWFLAASGVYFRDLAQLTGIISTVLLFLSPVFYPLSGLSPGYQAVLYFNPLTFVIESSRGALILGELPPLTPLAIYYFFSIAIAWLGFAWFQKTRRGFADVI
jgi:lipopolysaccharide transport system permease protein